MLAARLSDAVRAAKAVGAVAATVHKGSREYAAAGSAAPGVPMPEQAVVRIASITKPMVAMAVYQAFRDDLGALDIPVVEHLPQLRPQWRLHDGVTLRRVLSHTSGMRDADSPTLAAYGDGDDALLLGVQHEVGLGNAWRPGTAWAYCNSGFRLAGAVLAERNGTTFEQALTDLVLTPAGMAYSGFDTPKEAATGHTKGEPQPDSYVRARRPGGGLWSTTGDVLSFAEYAMTHPAFLTEARKVNARSAFGHRYGLGCFLNGDLMFHFGNVGTFQGLLVMAPDQGIAAVAVGNDEHGGKIARRIAFGEVARLMGRKPIRANPVRLADEVLRRRLAKLLT